MFRIYSSDDIEETNDGLDTLQAETNLPPIEFARLLLQKAEEITREEAQRHVDAERMMHEPDFVSLAERIAGIAEHTQPTRQCR